jgi:outer membrane lipoprotein-sorting protein
MQSERVRARVCFLRFAFCLLPVSVASGCAQRTIQLPTGAGTPLVGYAAIHADVTRGCAGVRTLTAELALSGRAGDQKVRGRALAGFQTPDAMRLEGLAPFGAPAFILVARDRAATLLLPRDDRVLRGASAEAILGALTGVSLAPADLQAILTGCVMPSPTAVNGAQHGPDWRAIELQDGAAMYLRRVGGTWQLRAATRGQWRIEYAASSSVFPRSVRLIRGEAPTVDMTAEISQLETNVAIDPAAFAVDVPRDALPITLDELRDAGPLRGTTSR